MEHQILQIRSRTFSAKHRVVVVAIRSQTQRYGEDLDS